MALETDGTKGKIHIAAQYDRDRDVVLNPGTDEESVQGCFGGRVQLRDEMVDPFGPIHTVDLERNRICPDVLESLWQLSGRIADRSDSLVLNDGLDG